MDLKTYIEDPKRRHELAAALDTSPQYLWQMATGWNKKKPSPELAVRIERATNGAVTCKEMRNDFDWTYRSDGSITYSVTVKTPVASQSAAA